MKNFLVFNEIITEGPFGADHSSVRLYSEIPYSSGRDKVSHTVGWSFALIKMHQQIKINYNFCSVYKSESDHYKKYFLLSIIIKYDLTQKKLLECTWLQLDFSLLCLLLIDAWQPFVDGNTCPLASLVSIHKKIKTMGKS